MKPLLLLLSVFLLSSCSQEPPLLLIRDGITYDQNTNEPFTGIVEEFYEDGQLETRKNYKDGKEDGLSEGFYRYGQLRWRTNFIDGVRDGLWGTFYENGQLKFRGNWIDGKEDGLHEMFDEDGNLTRTRTYRNGELVE